MPGGTVQSTAGKGWFDECSIDRDIETGDNSYEYKKMCFTVAALFSCQLSHLGLRHRMVVSHWTLP